MSRGFTELEKLQFGPYVMYRSSFGPEISYQLWGRQGRANPPCWVCSDALMSQLKEQLLSAMKK